MQHNPDSWMQAIETQELRVREETEKLLGMHRDQKPRKIEDYTLQTKNGPAKLSSFFNGKNELILIHNMGKKCIYCTTWADGINGFTGHMMDRSSLLLVSGDDVATQTEFATSRGWKFPMASTKGITLFKDLGFQGEHKDGTAGDYPGVSIILKDDKGQLWQKTAGRFGPGDLFCSIWNFFGLLPSQTDWQPKYKY